MFRKKIAEGKMLKRVVSCLIAGALAMGLAGTARAIDVEYAVESEKNGGGYAALSLGMLLFVPLFFSLRFIDCIRRAAESFAETADSREEDRATGSFLSEYSPMDTSFWTPFSGF
ncbi:MAG: hypothetical protein LBS00_06615 [Synergistaceae bacterium]|nr:hypothetical protein [Synergistaceae bacterium]